MREGLTQLEEFRYQWPDLKAQWGSMRSCRQESLSLYGSTLLFSQENLCCCSLEGFRLLAGSKPEIKTCYSESEVKFP